MGPNEKTLRKLIKELSQGGEQDSHKDENEYSRITNPDMAD